MTQKKVKESYIKPALANDYKVSQASVNSIEWTEAAGAGVTDGYTTEIIAIKGTAEVNNKTEQFSYIVKMAPESGHLAQMVKEVSRKSYQHSGITSKLHMYNKLSFKKACTKTCYL